MTVVVVLSLAIAALGFLEFLARYGATDWNKEARKEEDDE